jgi:phage baseplate assembly protein V
MLRFGNITEIDVSKCYARVKFLDDGIVSAPLQIVVMGALSTKFFHIFDINEQVACLMDENSEDGVILGAVFSDDVTPNGGDKDVVRVLFPDDSSIEYNRNSHEYNIEIKGKINITADAEVNLDAQVVNLDAEVINATATSVNIEGATNITGATEITGNLIVTGNITASGTVTATTAVSTPSLSGPGVSMSSGNITADGDITSDGEVLGNTVKAGTINLATHVHSGVQTGGSSTAPPTP